MMNSNRKLLTTLSLLSTLHHISAHPFAAFDSKGVCPSSRFLNEDQYQLGYTTFCNNHIAAPGNSGLVSESAPRTITITLQDDSGADIPWVFIVAPSDHASTVDATFNISNDLCMAMFRRVLEGAATNDEDRRAVIESGLAHAREKSWEDFVRVQGGGGFGKEYCAVEGSGSDTFSGEARTLVMGGAVIVDGVGPAGGSKVRFETRARRGG